MRPFTWILWLAVLSGASLSAKFACAQAARPNIVHIFADDLGWGSVGFNGQTLIATPNLDALANGGMRLANAYSAPVCAPSRGMLYTGFHQGHGIIDGNSALTNNISFRQQDTMTAEVLAPAGYTSGVFGKWGFGANGGSNPQIILPNSLPNDHGFSTFYGYLNHGAGQNYFYSWMWSVSPDAPVMTRTPNNGGPNGAAEYTHDLIAERSEQFVAEHAGGDPFYMQVNYTIPHYNVDSIANAPGGYGQYSDPAYSNWTTKQKAYAAMITRMDASIGSLVARLDDPDGDGDNSDSVLSNTLIMFTSDNGADSSVDTNGPTDNLIEFFSANGAFRGNKFELYEGGVHMPAVAYWPGVIQPGSVSNYRTDLTDFMATAADLAGVEAPVGIDGTSLAPILTGQGPMRERDYLVFEHQGAHGGDADPRTGRWAVVRQDGMKLIGYDNGTQVLFNLNNDPSEASPLNLSNPANAQLAADLEALAIAEGVHRSVVEFPTWNGPSGGNLHDDANWSGTGRPHRSWSATIRNQSAAPAVAHVSVDVTTLGIEVRGDSASQVVDVHAGRTLYGRNEVRIGANGRVDLSGGTLATNRWVNVRDGGEIAGSGTIVGDVYNQGVLAPGRDVGSSLWPIVAPPELPPISLNTSVQAAATFDFAGVQDTVPILNMSAKSGYVEIVQGLDFGPGVGPRLGNGGTDAGNEFNIIGHSATSLQNAIAAGDYISFSVEPIHGVGIIPTSLSFNLWRNGTAAGQHWAILSSIDGFSDSLAQATYNNSGSGSQNLLTATLPSMEALTGPVEFRLYGWGATSPAGNTHINAASLNARFGAVPTIEFNFAGVQDGAPLTTLKRSDPFLRVSSGLNFGLGLSPRGTNNAGNEFHVSGFSTGATVEYALAGNDYLTFSVQAIEGMAMYVDSASFTLWRQASGSATNYAIFSSVDGFAAGQQIAQTTHSLTGSSNQLTLTGSVTGAPPTTEPVEFRLYGWGSTASQNSTHIVAASMRARYASVAGSEIDPTGLLTVQGDLFHLAGGTIAIDLAGTVVGTSYDALAVNGLVQLEGDLVVSLADVGGSTFAPSVSDSFSVLTATQGITGEFNEVDLPMLAMGLDWRVDYLANAVTLTVIESADFNHDGVVNSLDYIVWRMSGGSGQLFDLWTSSYGSVNSIGSGGSTSAENNVGSVPEPTSVMLFVLASAAFSANRGRRVWLR